MMKGLAVTFDSYELAEREGFLLHAFSEINTFKKKLLLAFGAVSFLISEKLLKLGLTLLAFVSSFATYLLCFCLIIAANIIIRLTMFLVAIVTWIDKLFLLNYKRIHGSTKTQSSPVKYLNQNFKTMEKQINDNFTNLFLLWIPANYTLYHFIDCILCVHRRTFRIPESLHGLTFLRLFYSSLKNEDMDGCGTADDKRPKKSSRYNARIVLIYWFILRSQHMCTAIIRYLLLTVRTSLNFALWIVPQTQTYEVKSQLSNYEEAERKNLACAKRLKTRFIAKTMKPNFRQILLIWCPTDVVAPDTIVTFLSNFQANIEVREQWNKIPATIDSSSTFGGLMASFSSYEKMDKAARALAISFKHLKCISAKKLLSFIMHAEVNHSDCGFKNCEVIVRGRRGITEEYQKQKMKEILSEYGIFYKITFNENFQNLGMDVICTVEYAYATHAYFAKLYIDGTVLRRNMFSIEIKETVYVKQIMSKVKGILIETLQQNRLIDF